MAQDISDNIPKPKPQHTQLPLPLSSQKPKNAFTSQYITPKDDVSEARHTTEHTFLTDVADVRQMEHSLLQLLDDFHLGKLQAFGLDCTFEKMDEVRERQERLARLHFDLDSHQDSRRTDASNTDIKNKNFDKLMGSLHELCTAVQNLQTDEQPAQQTTTTNTTSKTIPTPNEH